MKVALITLNGNDNYGNKLQHYAIQKYIEEKNANIETLEFLHYNKVEYYIKHILKIILRKRYRIFCNFDKKIKYYKKIFFYNNKIIVPRKVVARFDKFIVGSDQVWNSTINSFNDQYLLKFVNDNNKKYSLSASFGVEKLPTKDSNVFKTELKKFHMISVREEAGKKIIEELTGRKDIEVLVDPTMLLTSSEWDKVSKKPKQLNKIEDKKYILNYFLGDLSDSRKKEIEKIANENDCEIINLLDKSDPFYTCGPSEFLYLEKNAFLICTDSFHSSVFAILYNRPFVIFDREQKDIESMNSRIDTLINKFKLKNRVYNGINITKENLNHDYIETYKILGKERKKSEEFLKKTLDIK